MTKYQAIQEAISLLTEANYTFLDTPFKALQAEKKRLDNKNRLIDERINEYRKQTSKYRSFQNEITH